MRFIMLTDVVTDGSANAVFFGSNRCVGRRSQRLGGGIDGIGKTRIAEMAFLWRKAGDQKEKKQAQKKPRQKKGGTGRGGRMLTYGHGGV